MIDTKKMVPVAPNGTILPTTKAHRAQSWIDSSPFVATLRPDGFRVGASARTVWMKDDNGRRYPMNMSDFFAYTDFMGEGCELSAKFKFKKRGAYWRIVVDSSAPLMMLAAQSGEEDV